MTLNDILVSLRELSRTYQEGDQVRIVLQSVDMDIRRGEHVALLGQSGSGKSTLLNLISGIDQPNAGDILLEGRNLTRMNERERTLFRRSNIGFVYQFFNLIPTLDVGENLLLPLELNGYPTKEAQDLVQWWLSAVGLQDRQASYPDRLSGGEQQRVAVARALIHSPSLVLADEPTGNLDAETGVRVLNLLDQLTQQTATTLLVVTHSREVAERADRVVVLEGGRLSDQPGSTSW